MDSGETCRLWGGVRTEPIVGVLMSKGRVFVVSDIITVITRRQELPLERMQGSSVIDESLRWYLVVQDFLAVHITERRILSRCQVGCSHPEVAKRVDKR
jgi:hypothetical protein